MELTINIKGLETLANAIEKLAGALNCAGTPFVSAETLTTKTAEPVTPPVAAPAPVQQPTIPPAPVPQNIQPPVAPNPQPPVCSAPVAPPAPVQQPPIPTTHVAQEYTQDQLARALCAARDANRMDVVQTVFQTLGVTNIMEIPHERYGEAVNILRGAGVAV